MGSVESSTKRAVYETRPRALGIVIPTHFLVHLRCILVEAVAGSAIRRPFLDLLNYPANVSGVPAHLISYEGVTNQWTGTSWGASAAFKYAGAMPMPASAGTCFDLFFDNGDSVSYPNLAAFSGGVGSGSPTFYTKATNGGSSLNPAPYGSCDHVWFPHGVARYNGGSAYRLTTDVAVVWCAIYQTNRSYYPWNETSLRELTELGNVLEPDPLRIYVDFAEPVPEPEPEPDVRTFSTGWRVRGVRVDTRRATLDLEEGRGQRVELPREVWSAADFPGLHKAAEGRRRPLVYGAVEAAPCFCVDAAEKRFRVAGHALAALGAVYQGDEVVAVSDVDLETAAFTCSGWDGSAELAADVWGKPGPDGRPLTSPADVLEDLLTVEGGEAAEGLDADSFAEARAALLLGHDREGGEVHRFAVSLYVGEAEELGDVLSRVLASSFCLLYRGLSGAYRLRYWSPATPAGRPRLAGPDVLSAELEESGRDVYSRVVARYAARPGGGSAQVETARSEGARLARLAGDPTSTADLDLSERRDAAVWASRQAFLSERPPRLWTVRASPVALLLEPGDFVWIECDRSRSGGERLRGLCDVLAVEGDPLRGPVDLLVSELRGYRDRAAHVAEEGVEFPAELGGGNASVWDDGWSAAEKAWARASVGYVSDAFGFVSPGEADTWERSVVA